MPITKQDVDELLAVFAPDSSGAKQVDLDEAPSALAIEVANQPHAPGAATPRQHQHLDPGVQTTDTLALAALGTPLTDRGLIGILKLGRALAQPPIPAGAYVLQAGPNNSALLVDSTRQSFEVGPLWRRHVEGQGESHKAQITHEQFVLTYGMVQYACPLGSEALISEPERRAAIDRAESAITELTRAGYLGQDEPTAPDLVQVGEDKGSRLLILPASQIPEDEKERALLGVLEVLAGQPFEASGVPNGGDVKVTEGRYVVRLGGPNAAVLYGENANYMIALQRVPAIDPRAPALGCWQIGNWRCGC